jgi:hypothetical protein
LVRPHATQQLVNFDTARFVRFRNHAFQIDIQQAVYQVGAANMNIFRKLEFALKVAFGDALIQVGTFFLLGGMGAFDDQQIVLRGDLQFAFSAKPATAIAMR